MNAYTHTYSAFMKAQRISIRNGSRARILRSIHDVHEMTGPCVHHHIYEWGIPMLWEAIFQIFFLVNCFQIFFLVPGDKSACLAKMHGGSQNTFGPLRAKVLLHGDSWASGLCDRVWDEAWRPKKTNRYTLLPFNATLLQGNVVQRKNMRWAWKADVARANKREPFRLLLNLERWNVHFHRHHHFLPVVPGPFGKLSVQGQGAAVVQLRDLRILCSDSASVHSQKKGLLSWNGLHDQIDDYRLKRAPRIHRSLRGE